MTYTPQSPDLNQVEKVWDELDQNVQEKQPTPQGRLLENHYRGKPHEAERENVRECAKLTHSMWLL